MNCGKYSNNELRLMILAGGSARLRALFCLALRGKVSMTTDLPGMQTQLSSLERTEIAKEAVMVVDHMIRNLLPNREVNLTDLTMKTVKVIYTYLPKDGICASFRLRERKERKLVWAIRVGGLLEGVGRLSREKVAQKLIRKNVGFVEKIARKYAFLISKDEVWGIYGESVAILFHQVDSGAFKENSTLNTYLISIFKYQLFKYTRKRPELTREDIVNWGMIQRENWNLLDDLIQKDLLERIMKLLKEKKEACLYPIELWMKGFPMKEIAQLINRTIGATRTHIHRCLEFLRERF